MQTGKEARHFGSAFHVFMCVLGIHRVLSKDALFSAMKVPSTGMWLCANQQSNKTSHVQDKQACALQCKVDEPLCTGFNFWTDKLRCEMYLGAIPPSFSVSTGKCFHFRKHTTEGPAATISASTPFATTTQPRVSTSYWCNRTTSHPRTPTVNCSFPFTYNSQLYFSAAQNVIVGNVTYTDSCYWTRACPMVNRTWAVCEPPSTAATYVATNSTTNLTIPTFNGTTIVQSLAGWIVFQQRIDGTVAFDQTWSVYKAGFGTYTGNYWMGLEKIYQLTRTGRYRLRMEVLGNGKWTSDEYFSFYLDSETSGYALHVDGYSGENGDVLRWTGNSFWMHNGMKFSTKDVHNDLSQNSCNPQTGWSGGWWYNACWIVNLNGNYSTSSFQYYWASGTWYNVVTSRMMIRSV